LKFAILHHGPCRGRLFHYRISTMGAVARERDESQPGKHKQSIDIMLDADCNAAAPPAEQIEALQVLLLDLKKRFPDIEVAGHRQVRGAGTDCPGKCFPLVDLRKWSQSELLAERDDAMREAIDRQYYRR